MMSAMLTVLLFAVSTPSIPESIAAPLCVRTLCQDRPPGRGPVSDSGGSVYWHRPLAWAIGRDVSQVDRPGDAEEICERLRRF
jgi:hypothetical protein